MKENDKARENTVSHELAEALSDLREQIDQVDDQLLTLLNQRARLVIQVGQRKMELACQTSIFQPKREAEILARLCVQNIRQNDCLPVAHIETIWGAIFAASKELQATVMLT